MVVFRAANLGPMYPKELTSLYWFLSRKEWRREKKNEKYF